MSMSTTATGLEGSFARMNLQQPTSRPAPSKGQPGTVHVLSPAEQRELDAQVTKMIETKQKVAIIDAKIAQAQAKQAEAKKEMEQGRALQQQGKALQQQGKALQQQAQAQSEQAKVSLAAHTAQVVKGLEGMAAALSKLKEVNKANSAKVQQIDALQQQILQFKNNLPKDTEEMKRRMQEFQKLGMALMQN